MRKIRTLLIAGLVLIAAFAASSLFPHESKKQGKNVTALSNRMPLAKLSGQSGESRLYEITLPPGASNLHFTTWRDGKGAIDLYIKHGSKPSRKAYDAKSTGKESDKLISIPEPESGKYYVLVDAAHGSYANHTLSASYSLPGETFKVGIHSHRLYNGGDWDGPESAEPLFKYALIRDLDISHLHDAAVWKRDGSIDFPLIDKIYSAHAKNGAKILKNFGTVPTWASARPDERNPYYPSWPGGLSGPRDLDEYEDYIFRFVSHTKKYLWAVEGWNEPFACPGDPPEFGTMTPTRLADIQKRVYRATKRAAPNMIVFSPPQAYVCGIPTILSARTSEGEPMWKFFDALSWHPYNRSARGNAGPSYAKELYEVRQHLEKDGLANMPIADSEHGWLTAPKEGGKEFYAMNDVEKAHVLFETGRLAKSLGVIAVIWYSYDSEMIGRPMTSPILSAGLQQMYEELNSEGKNTSIVRAHRTAERATSTPPDAKEQH
ncbi:PPC domain-containing protein [Oxalobacteraceae bacterium R-40]|uniref:PPC domain-containing protein n=1 Tax=Keguizhuia sedimenti TaxID=3064264 RepID=A0ABU1BTT4_9BURK|nr:PPC domain-containing protein [Oxalobacteraceae bacterium R-40]